MARLATDYLVFLSYLIGICSLLQLVQGWLGRFHLGQIVPVAVSSYAVAILTSGASKESTTLLVVLSSAGLLLTSLAFGFIALKASSELFVLSSLIAVVGTHHLAERWSSVTNGDLGVSLPEAVAIRELSVLGVVFVAAIYVFGIRYWEKSCFALQLRAWRDNRFLFEAIGRSPTALIFKAFCFAGIGSIPVGGLYATYLGFISPETFSLDASFVPVVALALYPRDDWRAVVIGPVVLVSLRLVLDLMGASEILVPLLYGLLVIGLLGGSGRLLRAVPGERRI